MTKDLKNQHSPAGESDTSAELDGGLNIGVKVKLDDGSIWDGYLTDENTVIVYPTDEYLEYYEFKYSGGNEFPEPVDNEYEIEDVEILCD